MKDEKFCFKKGTGLIALVGIFLVLAVFAMNMATEQQQTTSAKAFGSCPNSSLGDPFGKCPSNWIAYDANGNVLKDNKGNTCCYFNVNYTGICPSGSSPDTLGICPASKKTGVYITRKSDNKQVQCCNFIGTVKNTPAPVVSVAASTPRPTSPVAQAETYCKTVGLFNVPKDADGMTPRFVNDYFNLQCDKAENKAALWNGSFKNPMCYTRTGVCASNANCASNSCLIGYDNKAGCVYKPELNMEKCFTADPALKARFNPVCSTASPKYITDGKTWYIQGGKTCKTQGGEPYCCNLAVAEAQVPESLKKQPPTCGFDAKKIKWGPMTKVVNQTSGVVANIYTCYQTNASNGTSCTANRVIAQEFCQCYSDNNGNPNAETCKYAASLQF